MIPGARAIYIAGRRADLAAVEKAVERRLEELTPGLGS
jgi:hypothetical protein